MKALSDAPPVIISECPPLQSYERKELDRLADEIAKDPGALRNKYITDYSKLRDACRAIEKKKARSSQ